MYGPDVIVASPHRTCPLCGRELRCRAAGGVKPRRSGSAAAEQSRGLAPGHPFPIHVADESDASTRLLAHAKEERCTGRMSLLHLPIGPVPFVVANSGVAQQWVLSHGGRVQPPPRKAAA